MRPLVIGKDEREAIAKVVAHAKANVITRRDVLAAMEGVGEAPGDREGFSCEIPMGFRAVFSVEDQPSGMVRHLSVSVDQKDKCPNPHAVQLLAVEFGFDGEIMDGSAMVWTEEIGPGRTAINVAQRIEEATDV